VIDDELNDIIAEWWNWNLKLRIMTDIDGADEKDFIIDLRLLEEEYENINRSWKDLYEFYKKEKNEEGIIDVFDKKNRAEAGYRLINAFYDCPEKTLEKLNEKLKSELEWDTEIKKFPKFQVINAPEIEISKINKNHIRKMIQIKGIIKSMSQPLLNIIEGVWECNSCGHKNYVQGSIKPKYCEGCGKKANFLFLEEESKFETYREIKVQEMQDGSKFYDSILIEIPEEYISTFSLGNKVKINGIIKTKSTMDNKNKEKKAKEFYMEAISIFNEEDNKIEITNEDLEKIFEFSKKKNVLDELAQLYAPSIVGHEDIKKAIILQAVGGVEKYINGTRIRGNIHILLIGDPGTAKSQLLMWNKNAVQKSMYVADASGAGLTVAITRSNDQTTWEAGVLVLANNGVACIDELEKMRDEDRQLIHPAMEQGIVSKAKGGFFITAQANTSILASANPKFGRFDPSKILSEQITLPPTILNRFDLIFFVIDKIDEFEKERFLAKSILKTSNKEDTEFLKKYIEYAKNLKPKLTDLVINEIAEKYAKIRVTVNAQDKKIPINARNLQTIVRLAEAHAKLRLDEQINTTDIDVAFSLISEFLQRIGNDVDGLSIPSQVRKDAESILSILQEFGYIDYQKLNQIAEEKGIKNLQEAIEILLKNKDIREVGNGISLGGLPYA
jgi:replicative DNA helicase Mcm